MSLTPQIHPSRKAQSEREDEEADPSRPRSCWVASLGAPIRCLAGVWLALVLVSCQGQNRHLGYPKRNKEVAVVSTACEAAVVTSLSKSEPAKSAQSPEPEGPYYAPYDGKEVF